MKSKRKKRSTGNSNIFSDKALIKLYNDVKSGKVPTYNFTDEEIDNYLEIFNSRGFTPQEQKEFNQKFVRYLLY
ncbi:hypothetical protein CYK62_11155 [Clostridium perfringens]|uniref:hypothetical protein n=1 Tax=Clostridium perfringens TaxID=1502 RepID=UPI000D71989B|nr:hypothetical protein [Clostridium perfringens]MBO3320270.1 hypothetical protein [Clostridium perfringens]PWX20499.1 hypothetical protein CYK62_11155 [Clostridium perfringens]